MLAALGALWSQTALAGTLAWRVTEVSGNVQVKRAERPQRAVKGQSLAVGDVVTTGRDGRAVIARGKEFIVVAPTTQLRLPGEAQRSIIQVIQDYGRAMFSIEKKSTAHFAVGTPYLAAVVKGTAFTVTVGELGASVRVSEGVVDVETPTRNAHQLTGAGQVVSVLASNTSQIVPADLPGGERAAAIDSRHRADKADKGNRRLARDKTLDGVDKAAGSPGRTKHDRQAISGTVDAARAESAAARDNVRAARDNARSASQAARDARETVKASRSKKGI